MSKQNLAMQLRPKSMDDVIGQDGLKPGIRDLIANEHRQWLFYGPTGTGKTTVALILAREIQGKDFAPNLEPDLLELNAADFRGIADMREVLNQTRTYPMNGKYRVIILDEAHQLTKEAQTMLLKPLEAESRNVWIFCTTEPDTMLKTLRSRCQQFYFEPMGTREREKLVTRAARHMKYSADTSAFVRRIEKFKVESARDILMAFEKFAGGMSVEKAVEE